MKTMASGVNGTLIYRFLSTPMKYYSSVLVRKKNSNKKNVLACYDKNMELLNFPSKNQQRINEPTKKKMKREKESSDGKNK